MTWPEAFVLAAGMWGVLAFLGFILYVTIIREDDKKKD